MKIGRKKGYNRGPGIPVQILKVSGHVRMHFLFNFHFAFCNLHFAILPSLTVPGSFDTLASAYRARCDR